MTGERTFLQVPPDSSGKRVRLTHTAQIFYNSLSPSGYAWDIGERYFVDFTDNTQYYIHVHGAHAITATTGVLEVHYEKSAKYDNLSPKVGATILDEDGVTPRAIVESIRDVYVNSNHIIGFDNPEYGVDVDATGSMNMRFAEGLPQLDAFGKLRTSGASILGDYTFANNLLNDQFATTKWGTGTAVFNDNLHCAELSTGISTATANYGPDSHRVQMTTNTYHHYFPGLSQLAIMTVALSEDVGYPGVMREWGYFDGEYDYDITNPSSTNELVGGNGYFFRTTGTSGLQLVIRSSAHTTGDITERIITKTGYTVTTNGVVTETNIEAGFNGDPVDGTGNSGKVLDLSNDNIYWIDIQWLGAGRVRFGTYHDGERVVIHSYYHEGSFNGGKPHSQTGSLPLRFCQHNMSGQAVDQAGKFLRVWCGAVYTEANIDTATLGQGRTEYFKAIIDPTNMNDVQGNNDAFGDRVITTKTGITSSGTTLTVPDLTGIKPGWIVKVSSGTGVMQTETRVSDIISSTEITVDKAPTTAIINTDSVTFEMPVNDEYYLIGILAPLPQLKNVNHPNRTLHLPRSARGWAYYEDGSPAHISFQVYVNPVISGVNRVSNLYDEAEAASLGVDPVFTRVEPNDPGNSVMAYGKAGIDSVNLFRDSGIHALVTYNGETFQGAQEDLSSAFTSLQSSFKNAADNGGNNRCPILKVFQSPSAGKATVVQINTPPTGVSFSLHREGNAIQFENIPNAIGTDNTLGLNKNTTTSPIFYLRMIDNDKAELYTDKNFQTPWDTSSLSTATNPNGNSLTWPGNTGGDVANGGFILSGYGPEVYFCIFAKPQGPSKADSPYYTAYQESGITLASPGRGKIECNFALFWNEIRQ
jgi:hypothetical protein